MNKSRLKITKASGMVLNSYCRFFSIFFLNPLSGWPKSEVPVGFYLSLSTRIIGVFATMLSFMCC